MSGSGTPMVSSEAMGDNIFAIGGFYARLAATRRADAEKQKKDIKKSFDDDVDALNKLIECAKSLGVADQDPEIVRLLALIATATTDMNAQLDRLLPAAKMEQSSYESEKEDVRVEAGKIMGRLPKLSDESTKFATMLLAKVPPEAPAATASAAVIAAATDPVSVAIRKLTADIRAAGVSLTTRAQKDKINTARTEYQATYTTLRSAYVTALNSNICDGAKAKEALDTWLNTRLPENMRTLMSSIVTDAQSKIDLDRAMKKAARKVKETAAKNAAINSIVPDLRTAFQNALAPILADIACCDAAKVDVSSLVLPDDKLTDLNKKFAELIAKYTATPTSALKDQLDAVIRRYPPVNAAQKKLEVILVQYRTAAAAAELPATLNLDDGDKVRKEIEKNPRVKALKDQIDGLTADLAKTAGPTLIAKIKELYLGKPGGINEITPAIEAAVKPIRDSIKDDDPFADLKKKVLTRFVARMKAKLTAKMTAVFDEKKTVCEVLKDAQDTFARLNEDPLKRMARLQNDKLNSPVFFHLTMNFWVEFKLAEKEKLGLGYGKEDDARLFAKLDPNDASSEATAVKRDFTAFYTYTGINILDPNVRKELANRESQGSQDRGLNKIPPKIEYHPNPKSLKDNPNVISTVTKVTKKVGEGEPADTALILEVWTAVEDLLERIRTER